MTEKDKLIDQLLAEVEKQKAEIKSLKKPSFETNMSFTNAYDRPVNLHVALPNILLDILTYMKVNYDGFMKLKEEHKFDYEFIHDGYSYHQWEKDIIIKLNQHKIKEKQKALKANENKLKNLMSKDRKDAIELDNIKKSLNL